MSAAKSLALFIRSETGFFAVSVFSLIGILLDSDNQSAENYDDDGEAKHEPLDQYFPLMRVL